jgi:tetratricopeptide (TPR) repeat protein
MWAVKRVLIAAGVFAAVLSVAYVVSMSRRDGVYSDLLHQGDAAMATGDTAAAIEAFTVAVGLKPDTMVAYLKRGEAYRQRDELEAALRDLRTATDLDRTATRPRELLGDVNYALQRYVRAAERYAEYLALDDQSPRVAYKLGLAQYHGGQAGAAIETLGNVLALESRFAEAYYLLALCLRETQKPKEALVALERAVALSPAMLQAREELADLYGRLGRPEDRIDQLDALLALDPGPSREVALGLAYASSGDQASAIQTLGRAARRYPDYQHTYVALGRVWLDTAQAREDRIALGKALEALRSATGIDDTSERLTLLGRALLLAGEVEQAERALQQATERLPLDPLAFLYLADAAERRGHVEIAREALIDYHALEGDDGSRRRLARLAARVGDLSVRLADHAAAVEWYQRAVDAAAPDASLLVHLATAQWKSGRADAARVTVARALALEDDHPGARELRRRIRPN